MATIAKDIPRTVQELFGTPKETWQYVAIPDEDPTGLKFPSIGLNKIEFRAGETYHLPVAIASFVKERVKAFNRSVTRLFSPQVDRLALNEVAVGTTASASPGGHRPGFVDASTITGDVQTTAPRGI
jgi:hypothetical protein